MRKIEMCNQVSIMGVRVGIIDCLFAVAVYSHRTEV